MQQVPFLTVDETLDIKAGYHADQLEVRLLSLTPPPQSLRITHDPILLPHPSVAGWIWEQEPFTAFQKRDTGHRVLHLHGCGNPSIDIPQVSRLLRGVYDHQAAINSGDILKQPVLYFEFDRRDSRYSSLYAMLTFLINILFWRFWYEVDDAIIEQLKFLHASRAWTLQDLYNLYSTLRLCSKSIRKLTVFVSCFDQCPEDQRRWFMRRVLEELNYGEGPCHMILSTSAQDGLAVENFPANSCINLNDCPVFNELHERHSEEIGLGLDGLIASRPIYSGFRPQLEKLLRESDEVPELWHAALKWFESHHQGGPKAEILNTISQLSPLTPTSLVQVFISALTVQLKRRAMTAFNWIKYVAEPWSPDALVEALAVHELRDEEPSFNDLDKKYLITEIKEALDGIVIVKDHDVKFSHSSFYLVPEVGIDGHGDQAAAVHASIAWTCLRYFQLESAQEVLSQFVSRNLEDGPWETALDAVVIACPRVTMAEYAVRFWPHHYKSGGQFKPKGLVRELFASRKARTS